MPFTTEQFFQIFETYNTAIWPMPIVAYALGLMVLVLAFRDGQLSARIVSGILAFFWGWMGISYHIFYFRAINPGAWIFGVFYVFQALLFLLVGTISGRLRFCFSLAPLPVIGACFILYGMVFYPLLGVSLGHLYPRAPMFGVAPCPTTIFTFGILLWAKRRVPGYLLIVPFLWSLLGMSAAVNLHVPQDYGLVVAGVLGTALILIQNRKAKRETDPHALLLR